MSASSANTFLGVFAAGLAVAGLFVTRPAIAASEIIQCTVILDQQSARAIARVGACDQRFTPMSTFKVPLALMGFDSGILKDARTPRWEYDPSFNAPKRTRKAVDPTIWEADSILWYSQELTRKMGKETFDRYVRTIGYGSADTSGKPGDGPGLTHSWLASSLVISPDEQAELMRRIVARDLPVSRKAIDLTVSIIPRFEAEGWKVQGKTGSGWLRRNNGKIDRNRPVGWFVGWAEKQGRQIAFARLWIGVERPSEPPGLALRALFLKELPKMMKAL